MADSKKVNFYGLIEANNQLAVKLYKLLAGAHENVFFCPLSISTALSMLFHGASGRSSEEMRKILGYDSSNLAKNQVAICFSNFLQDLKSNSYSHKVSLANSLLIHKKFAFKEKYKIDLKIFYRALVKEVDFEKDSQNIAAELNEYVKQNTNHMILRILDSVDPDALMIVLSAVYFKGTWLHQFEKHWTYPQMFYNNGKESNAKEIPMMHLKRHFPFIQKEFFKALQLPYRGEDIVMLILLPRSKTGLPDLESNLTDNFIVELRRDMFILKVEVSLPKFRMEYTKSMSDSLQKIGLKGIFHSDADFSELSDCSQVSVSDIIHKAVLEVNEEGIEAAAAVTAVSTGYRILDTPVFNVDHPFMFVILDTKKNLILFMGRIEEL